jgi:hypothetical protein
MAQVAECLVYFHELFGHCYLSSLVKLWGWGIQWVVGDGKKEKNIIEVHFMHT